jgi:hypothetical protein
MAGRAPGVTIHPNELSHLSTAEWYAHQIVPKATGILEESFVESAAIQKGGRGICVGRGCEVTFSKL